MKDLFIVGIFISLFFSLSLLSSCFYDNEEDLYGTSNFCDTTNVSYSNEVATILDNNCLTCHSTAAANALGAGIVLDSYDGVLPFASGGTLYDVINATDVTRVMPPSGKMADCNIEQIKAWIDAGALDN